MKNNYFRPFVHFMLTGALAFSATHSQAQNIFAITSGNQLISFPAATPALTSPPIAITGLVSGQTIVGMDFRPNSGQLYILGYNSVDSSANLYTVNKSTAIATKIGSITVKLALGDGSKVGFDFNPTVDRIRIVAGTDVSYRMHPITGALAFTDGNLKFAAGDVNFGKNPNAAASAYTNSYIGAGTTTLFNYDDSLNVIVSQNPPNDGTLNTIGATGIVSLTTSMSFGFDIYKDPATLANTSYLSMSGMSGSSLYTVDLVTGMTSLKGPIGTAVMIKDIAVEIDRTLPEPRSGMTVYALQGTNLISFNSDSPQLIRTIYAITGVPATQTIVGMDARPKTKELFILGYNSTSGESQLFVLNPMNGIATPVGTSTFTLALGTGPVGFDFNPTVDRIRVVGSNNNNYRLNPLTGGIAFTDMTLKFAPGDVNAAKNPSVNSVAYTNSFDGTTTTQLIGYDDSLNVFVLQNPPNDGILNTLISSPIMVNMMDPTTDIDIYFDNTAKTNTAFMAANTGARTNDSLYLVDFTSGTAMVKGLIGLGVSVRDIALAIDTVSVVTGLSDGNSSFSSNSAKVYPNPLSDQATMQFNLANSANVQLNILNMLGEVIETSNSQFSAGDQLFTVVTSGLKDGIYLFELKVNGERKAIVKATK